MTEKEIDDKITRAHNDIIREAKEHLENPSKKTLEKFDKFNERFNNFNITIVKLEKDFEKFRDNVLIKIDNLTTSFYSFEEEFKEFKKEINKKFARKIVEVILFGACAIILAQWLYKTIPNPFV